MKRCDMQKRGKMWHNATPLKTFIYVEEDCGKRFHQTSEWNTLQLYFHLCIIIIIEISIDKRFHCLTRINFRKKERTDYVTVLACLSFEGYLSHLLMNLDFYLNDQFFIELWKRQTKHFYWKNLNQICLRSSPYCLGFVLLVRCCKLHYKMKQKKRFG